MPLKKHPTKKRLRALFYYRNGFLIRRSDRGGEVKHSRIGSLDGHGYYKANVDRKSFQLHRLIWIWHYGATCKFIDHKNHNKLDNRIENLRLATKAHNEWHTSKRRHNTTGYKGVYLCKRGTPLKPYWAYITANGKRKGLGMYRTAKEASRAYNQAALKLHGEFACLNT